MTKNLKAMELSKEIVAHHRCFDVDDGSYGGSIRALEHRIAKALEEYAKEEEKKWSALIDRQNEALKIAVKCNGLSESAEVKLARAEEREACADSEYGECCNLMW